MAKFQSDMGKAAQTVEQSMQKMGVAANFVTGALAGIGASLTVGAFVQLVRGSIDAADHLRDMSQKTGIAAETLHGLAFAAGQAGGSLESMVAAAGKLNKSIVEAAGGNKDVGEAFSKLGINVKDASGQLKTADVVMAEVADQFAKYADGPEKTAIALRIFGKAGADMIPVLNDGGKAMRENTEYAKKYSGMTQELTEASDNFNDTMGKLKVQQEGFGNAMATAVLPIMQALANEYLTMQERSDKFAFASVAVRTVLQTFVVVGSEVAFTFKAVGTEIGGIMAQLDALAHGDLAGFTRIGEAMTKDAEAARKAHDEFLALVMADPPKKGDDWGVSGGWDEEAGKPRAPKLRAKGDDPTKALLDGRLKAIEAAYGKERDAASYHEKFMDALRSSAIVDMETYEAFKKATIEQNYAATAKMYDDEIAAIEKYRAAAGKETERAQADAQIAEKRGQKEQARIKATMDLSLLALNNDKVRHDLVKKWRAESDASTARDEANYVALHNSLLTQEEAEQQSYQDRIDGFIRFRDSQEANVEMANADIEREAQRHEQAMLLMKQTAQQQTLSLMANSSNQLYSVLQQAGAEQTALGRVLFVANKALAAAEIVVNTEIAASKALAMGPIIGPPLAIGIRALGYASAAIVAGTAIAGAREQGGPVWAGGAFLVGEKGPEIFKPTGGGTIIPNNEIGRGGAGSGINFAPVYNIQIDSRTDQAQVRQLVSGAVQQGNADLVEKLERAGRI